MKKFLIGLLCAAIVTPAAAQYTRQYPRYNTPNYSHNQSHRAPHQNYGYLAAPIIIGGLLAYVITNGANTVYIEREVPRETPMLQGEIREDAAGRVYELRNQYVERCRCFQAVWVQVYP